MRRKKSKDLSYHRLEQAKEDLTASKLLYNSKLYKSANNRAYYAIFHTIRSILALEPIDFKKHKDVIAHFNKNYIRTEIFSKKLGRKIVEASKIREDSDYDDEFIVSESDTQAQIQTAEELIDLAEKYINEQE